MRYLDPLHYQGEEIGGGGITVKGSFASDELAVLGGVLPGEYYTLTAGNIYGMKSGLLVKLS